MLTLHNSLSRKLEKFTPLGPKLVLIYTCGPTVYDTPHIGNWYAFLRWDLLIRALQASGYHTKWVMNITDVGHLTSDADEGQDKLEKGAEREHKTAWEVANEYSDYFLKGLERLNFSEPDLLPKATDNIPEQIKFVQSLEQQGLTYVIDDGVYFDTGKIDNYGKLAQLDVKNLIEGARVKVNSQKHHLSDFALWKFSPKDHKRDMEWDSPWGKGFPGWHLECSTMIDKFLGSTIDIHGGGIDHIPVHHTNEIAQSESLHHQPLANYWLHSNFIKVDGQKISKSLGNLITLEDIEKKGFSLEVFRLLVLESHYRSEAQFSWDTLHAAQNRLDSYQAMADLRWQPIASKDFGNHIFTDTYQAMLQAMQDDLDTPKTLTVLSNLANQLNADAISTNNVKELELFLEKINQLLGLQLSKRGDISNEQKDLLAKRQTARDNQDWAASDQIRDQLKSQGLGVRDTADGQIWHKIK